MSSSSGTVYYNTSGDYTTVSFAVKSCTFTPPTGKKFSHWNAQSDGSGTSYNEGGTVSTYRNVIFYAIWIAGRPNDWYWTSNVSKGATMPCTVSGSTVIIKPLTATEWLNFTERIEAFYNYLGLTINSTYWYRAVNGVVSGSPMTATQANGARWLIAQLSPPVSVPSAISSGGTITAAFVNGLKDSLNSIN
jgi:hypothetical protein